MDRVRLRNVRAYVCVRISPFSSWLKWIKCPVFFCFFFNTWSHTESLHYAARRQAARESDAPRRTREQNRFTQSAIVQGGSRRHVPHAWATRVLLFFVPYTMALVWVRRRESRPVPSRGRSFSDEHVIGFVRASLLCHVHWPSADMFISYVHQVHWSLRNCIL